VQDPTLPSGTVTFLFTDIEGSTRLLRALGERYEHVLAEHQRLLRAAFAAHHGHEVDTQGDSFFVAFRRAKDAVAAAIDAQRTLAANHWPDGHAVKVRMGIHTGEPVVGERRYTGIGVHRAARIGAVGHGGQVLLSNTTRELIEDDLPPGVALRGLGRHRLKDIQRPERIFQLVAEGLPSRFPPLRTVGASRRLRSKPVLAGVAALALAGAAVAVLLTSLGGSGTAQASSVSPNSVGILESKDGSIQSEIAVGAAPSGVAAGTGAVWVANTDAIPGSVSRIDTKTRSVRQEITVGQGPSGIAVGGGAVWVANGLDGTVSRIDPGSNQVVKTIRVGAGPSAIGWGAGAVWVSNAIDGTVSRIDPSSWRVTRTIPVAIGASALAVGFGRVWVASSSAGTVTPLDPATGEAGDAVNVGLAPDALAVGDGVVWVANHDNGTVMTIDPGTSAVTNTIAVGRDPVALAVGPESVWVANAGDSTLSRIDPARHAVVGTKALGNQPRGLAVSPEGLFVAVRSTGSEHRGGALHVSSAFFISDTMDPALSYNWQVTSVTHDGLLGFRRVGGVQGLEVVPDLAVSLATPTDGGRTYTYRLRRGVRYSNGQPVEPGDLRRALERVLHLRSPGAGYYSSVVGATACLAKPTTCDLSHGVVADAASRTVTFHLTEPDGDFQTKLALEFAAAVPSDTPFRDLGGRVPGTGPYRISRWVKGSSVTLVRNHRFNEWSSDAQPRGYPDTITVRVDGDFGRRTREVERGSVDAALALFVGGGKAQLVDLASRYPSRLVATTSAGTDYMFMNTRMKPFDDVQVRRAVNVALDRQQFVEQLGTLVHAPTCQVLPPNFRAYRPTCPYAGGLAAGRRLVARSGTRGQRVLVWVPAPAAEIGRYFVALLDELGFHATMKTVAPAAYFGIVGNPAARPQFGFASWASDYPAPTGFFQALFDCASGPGTNLARFCDPLVERRLKAAAALQAQNEAAATLAWQQAESAILDAAPIVPMSNSRNVDFISKRFGNYQFSPQQSGFLLDQAWVK
jgi:peptide/nickel transport system substrate-binding protein